MAEFGQARLDVRLVKDGYRGRVYRWDASGWCTTFSPEGSRDPRVLWDLSRQLLLALGGKDKTTE